MFPSPACGLLLGRYCVSLVLGCVYDANVEAATAQRRARGTVEKTYTK